MEIAVGGLLADITLLPEGEDGDLTPTALLLKSDVFWIKSASSMLIIKSTKVPTTGWKGYLMGIEKLHFDVDRLMTESIERCLHDLWYYAPHANDRETELGPERQLKTQAPLTTEIKCTDTGDASAEFPAVSESKEAIGTLSDKDPFSV
ncbi:unnamed protein product [Aphanomyces euteiches]